MAKKLKCLLLGWAIGCLLTASLLSSAQAGTVKVGAIFAVTV